jgi:hypothetical protein
MIAERASKQNILQAYNKLKAEMQAGNTHIEEGRLNRALGLALRKESYDKYFVQWTGCTCADAYNRPQFICKHRLAFMMEHVDELLEMIFLGTPIQ